MVSTNYQRKMFRRWEDEEKGDFVTCWRCSPKTSPRGLSEAALEVRGISARLALCPRPSRGLPPHSGDHPYCIYSVLLR